VGLARNAKVIAEWGTGKTLISLGAMHVHSNGRPFTALAMVPRHIVDKWAREAFQTIPGIRVFLIDNLRNPNRENMPHGIDEVCLKRGSIIRDGLRTSLTDLRLAKAHPSARKRWEAICHRPSLFIVGRDRAKLPDVMPIRCRTLDDIAVASSISSSTTLMRLHPAEIVTEQASPSHQTNGFPAVFPHIE